MNDNFYTSVIGIERENKVVDEDTAKKILKEVYVALDERGYDPIKQISEYLITGEPAYITSYNQARVKICRVDRFVLLELMMKEYIEKNMKA